MVANLKTISKQSLPSYWDFDRIYSSEEYFRLEEQAPFKSEFRNGKIYPMSGGTIEHNDISGNIYLLLRLIAKTLETTHRIFNSDQKIFIPAYNHGVYTDTCVVKGLPSRYEGETTAITNPMIVFEVLSNSTANYDRSAKFRKYQTLASFQEYVLIDQSMPIVDVLYKSEKGWLMNTYIGLDTKVPLETLGVELAMTDIYENVNDLKNPQVSLDFPQEN